MIANRRPDRRRSDPASRLAYFLNGYKAPQGHSNKESQATLRAEISKRFPGITEAELVRGYEIATELIRADVVYMNLETARLKSELRRRMVIVRQQR